LTLVVLFILATLWAAVLVPPLLRARRTERTGDSIGDFNYRLDVLSRTNGAAPAARRAADPRFPAAARAAHAVPIERRASLAPVGGAAKRRRDILSMLTAGAASTFLLAYGAGLSMLWPMNVAFVVLLVAYLGLWVWCRSVQAERTAKVRFFPQQRPAPELALRRTASS